MDINKRDTETIHKTNKTQSRIRRWKKNKEAN